MVKKLLIIALIAFLSVILFTGCPEDEEIDPDAYGWWLDSDGGSYVYDTGEVIFSNNNIHEILDVNWSTYEITYNTYPDDVLTKAADGLFETAGGYSGSYYKWYRGSYLMRTVTQLYPYYRYFYMCRYWRLDQVRSPGLAPINDNDGVSKVKFNISE